MTLEEYIKQDYPKIIEEYKRKTTPFYYEPGVLYHPITNGFGCGLEGSTKPLEIISGQYTKDGDVEMCLQNPNKPDEKYGVNLLQAHKKIKRLDESVAPIGRKIPNNRRIIYILSEGEEYRIVQDTWTDYSTKGLIYRAWIRKESDIEKWVDHQMRKPYYELKGSSKGWSLTYGYELSYNRDYFKINSVKEYKQIVFGDPNIKLKCYLFP